MNDSRLGLGMSLFCCLMQSKGVQWLLGDQNNNNITVNPVQGESRRPCIVSVVPREESSGEEQEQEIKER